MISVGNSVLYTRGRVHFEGYLRTGPTVGVFLDLPSGCPSYMTFVFKYMGLTAIRYIYISSSKKFHKNLLMTKSNDRMSDLVNGHASRPYNKAGMPYF